jgi:hypothetical protein
LNLEYPSGESDLEERGLENLECFLGSVTYENRYDDWIIAQGCAFGRAQDQRARIVVYDIDDSRQDRRSVKETALRLDGRIYSEFYKGKFLRAPNAKTYYSDFELPIYSNKFSGNQELPYKLHYSVFAKDRMGYMWSWDREVGHRGTTGLLTDNREMNNWDFFSGKSLDASGIKDKGLVVLDNSTGIGDYARAKGRTHRNGYCISREKSPGDKRCVQYQVAAEKKMASSGAGRL